MALEEPVLISLNPERGMAWGQAEASGHGVLAILGRLAGVPKLHVFVLSAK